MNERWIIAPFVVTLMIGVQACTYRARVKVTDDERRWVTDKMPEYGIEFSYPPEMVAGTVLGVVGGTWTCDGLKRSPHQIGSDYERLPLGAGEMYRFVIQIIMITEAAKMNDMDIRRYGWRDCPRTVGNPFHFDTDSRTLQVIIERLYIGCEPDWLEVTPATAGGKDGIHLARWMPPGLPRSQQWFEELTVVPVTTNRFLLLHAGYSSSLGEDLIGSRRNLYKRIVDTVRFTHPTGNS